MLLATTCPRYGRGIAQIDLFENLHSLPLAVALYRAENVFEPALSPSTTNDALAACTVVPARINECPSVVGVVPLTANPIKHDSLPVLDSIADVTDTSALVAPTGSVTVTDGCEFPLGSST